MDYRFLAVWFGIVALAAFAQAPGVSELSVESEITCDMCVIKFELVASLGHPNDPALPLPTARIARDRAGRLFAAPTFESGKIAVYDKSGMFLETMGREGQGPGEFGRITNLLVDSEDLLHVFERRRHTVLSVGSAEPRLVHALEGNPGSIIEVSSGRLVVQQIASGPDDLLIDVVDPEGSVATSFLPAGDPLDEWDRVRVLGRAKEDGVWVGRKNEYRIELWSLGGTRSVSVSREATFFKPWHGYDPREPTTRPPRPRLRSIHQDASGRVWVMIAVAAADWEPMDAAAEARVSGPARRARAQLWDTIIEVLELESGSVVSRRRVAGLLPSFKSAAGLVHTTRTSGDVDVIDVWRLRLAESQ